MDKEERDLEADLKYIVVMMQNLEYNEDEFEQIAETLAAVAPNDISAGLLENYLDQMPFIDNKSIHLINYLVESHYYNTFWRSNAFEKIPFEEILKYPLGTQCEMINILYHHDVKNNGNKGIVRLFYIPKFLKRASSQLLLCIMKKYTFPEYSEIEQIIRRLIDEDIPYQEITEINLETLKANSRAFTIKNLPKLLNIFSGHEDDMLFLFGESYSDREVCKFIGDNVMKMEGENFIKGAENLLSINYIIDKTDYGRIIMERYCDEVFGLKETNPRFLLHICEHASSSFILNRIESFLPLFKFALSNVELSSIACKTIILTLSEENIIHFFTEDYPRIFSELFENLSDEQLMFLDILSKS